MKNLNMWIKLGLGFGLVLALTCVMGGLAYMNMSATSKDTDIIALEYLPEVEYASKLDMALRQSLLSVRTFDFSGNMDDYAEAQRLFAEAHTYEKLLIAHSAKFPHLKHVKNFSISFPSAFSEYEALTAQSMEENKKMNANTGMRDSLSNKTEESLVALTVTIVDNLEKTQVENTLALLSRRIQSLLTTENIRVGLVDVRRQVALARLRSDQTLLQEVQRSLVLVTKNIDFLRKNIQAENAVAALRVVEQNVENYTNSVIELSNIWKKQSEIRMKRMRLADQLMTLTTQINEGGIGSSATLADFTSTATTVESQQMLYIVITVLLLGVLIAWALTHSITGPLQKGMIFAQAVAHGNLDERLTLDSKDELGRLADALRAMVESLKSKIHEATEKSEQARIKGEEATVAMETARKAQIAAEGAKRDGMLAAAGQLEDVVAIVSSASTELSAQIEQSERGSSEQAGRLSETATAMEEMNSTVIEVARNAGAASEVSAQTRVRAEEGAHVVQQVVDSIQAVQGASMALKTDMAALSEQAQGISQIMGVISDIADQTNLLALNAAIEAARAGEAGRGFAVVADEVRKLAEKTMTSTTDVGNAIKAIQQSAAKSVQQVESTVETIEKATGLAGQSGDALREIVHMVDNTADQVRAIATAAEQQSASSEEINRSITQVNSISAETARAMQEAAKAVNDLATQSHVLTSLIDEMKRS